MVSPHWYYPLVLVFKKYGLTHLLIALLNIGYSWNIFKRYSLCCVHPFSLPRLNPGNCTLTFMMGRGSSLPIQGGVVFIFTICSQVLLLVFSGPDTLPKVLFPMELWQPVLLGYAIVNGSMKFPSYSCIYSTTTY